jgi:hypothetical protein
MAISVVGNFDININSPIDSRLVATNSSAREAIVYKYPGLKVYLLEDGKTYVYGTNSQWTIDGGQGGGIYGGSGSLPDDVGVYMGSVGNSANDTSKKLYHFADSEPISPDRGYLYSYFYRNNDGGGYSYDLSYITEYKFYEDNQGVLITQGPFIEYNGLDDSYEDAVGNLILGTPKLSGVDKGKKIIISSSDYIAFNPSGNDNVFPLTIAYDSGLYFGWNYNPNLPNDSYLFDEYSSSRIKFDDSTIFESRKTDTNIWNQVLSINNNVAPNEVDSPISLMVDTSAKDWDSTVTRTTELKTVPGIVRDLEHRFTKLQMWNQSIIPTSLTGNVLLVSPDGNSFTYEFPVGPSLQGGSSPTQTFIKDIKIKRSNTSIQDFLDGAIISIKFTNEDQNVPGYLEIFNGGLSDSKIRSNTTDATFTSDRGSDKKLTIKYNTSTSAGDVITFVRMFGYWEILSIDTSFRITNRVWSTGSTSTFVFDSRIYYLTLLTTPSGRFLNIPASISNTVLSNGYPPNKINFSPTATTSTDRQSPIEGFKFRMSIDGNRNVMAQGNFRIVATMTDIPAVIIINRLNVWKVGEVKNYSYMPEFETVWTQAGGYMRDNSKSVDITISNVSFSINKLGVMFVSFVPLDNIEAGRGSVIFDVWVPPFSYQGNITVDPSSAPGGGGGDVVGF